MSLCFCQKKVLLLNCQVQNSPIQDKLMFPSFFRFVTIFFYFLKSSFVCSNVSKTYEKKRVENNNFRKVFLEVKKEKKKCFLVLVFSHITSVTVLGRKKCKGGRKNNKKGVSFH